MEILPSNSLTWLLAEDFTSLPSEPLYLAARDLEAGFQQSDCGERQRPERDREGERERERLREEMRPVMTYISESHTITPAY